MKNKPLHFSPDRDHFLDYDDPREDDDISAEATRNSIGFTRTFRDGSRLWTVWRNGSWWVSDELNDPHCGPYCTAAAAQEWIEGIIDNTEPLDAQKPKP